MMVRVPPQQSCGDVSKGSWNHVTAHCSPSFPSHLLGREDEHRKSCSPLDLKPRTINGVLGGGRPRPRDWQHRKTVAKQGDEHRSLGAIHPPGGRHSSSSIRESTPVERLFFQCLCTPEFASHHHQCLPLPGHPKCAIHTWSCPRGDRLGSDTRQTGECCWYRSSSGGMTAWFISSQILPDVNCRSSLGREPHALYKLKYCPLRFIHYCQTAELSVFSKGPRRGEDGCVHTVFVCAR